jgi:cytidine deaminase
LTVVGVYEPEHQRANSIAIDIEKHSRDKSAAEALAADIVNTDQEEAWPDKLGQQVRVAYPESDVFIESTSLDGLDAQVKRAIAIMFGEAFQTPYREEFGMSVAATAEKRSADPGRQVGAAIMASDGRIIATGANDVPRAGGGQYWPEHDEDEDREQIGRGDHREFRRGAGSVDSMKELPQEIAGDIVQRLVDKKTIPDATRDEALAVVAGSKLKDVIENTRSVHAEMAALMDAARTGTPVQGATVLTTSFPCPECSRHIVAAGVGKVVFVHPYPKSRAGDLHPDSIRIAGEEPPRDPDRRVVFEQFQGVAPRRYH